MKRFQSFGVLATLLALILTGCAGSEEEERVSLEIFQFKVEIAEQLDDLVADFERSTQRST